MCLLLIVERVIANRQRILTKGIEDPSSVLMIALLMTTALDSRSSSHSLEEQPAGGLSKSTEQIPDQRTLWFPKGSASVFGNRVV